jgi:N-acyl-D-aspartate/D-glutamate deacylase
MSELLIQGGTIVDGTGAPRYEGDVLVREGRIAEVGPHLSSAGRVLDASGLTVTPGIIDPHTHMDGQFFWAPDGSSSSWHGITTVLMGNCGYSLAPVTPEHRDYIIHMFARVEEIAPRIFQNNLPWDWVTYPEYLDALDHGLGMNVVSLLGHSTLRYHVMGPAAFERAAGADEIERMRTLLREALDAGAFGLTTSRAPAHVDWQGRPVPSRWAEPEELVRLAEVLGEKGYAALGMNPKGLYTGVTPEDKELLRTMARVSRAPIQLNGTSAGDTWEFIAGMNRQGYPTYSLTFAQPFYKFFSLRDDTTTFNSMDSWWQIMLRPAAERAAAFADPSLRPKLRAEVDAEPQMDPRTRRRPLITWDDLRVYRAARPENRGLTGTSIRALAQRQGKHLADTLLDLALAEDLETVFEIRFMPEHAWFEDPSRAELLNNPYCMPMNSDSGAHIGSECRTGEPTYFLRHWVLDRGVMSLEEGVRKVTSQAAQWMRLPDRGVLKPGLVADIAIFDLDRVDAAIKEPAHDLPDGGLRWIQKASGVEYVLVNGEPTIWQGKPLEARPGKVLRSGWYRS